MKGFDYHGKRIMFVDPRGKDPRPDMDRWRMSLYYGTHYARTHFCYSQAEYDAALAAWLPVCWGSYEEWRLSVRPWERAEVTP